MPHLYAFSYLYALSLVCDNSYFNLILNQVQHPPYKRMLHPLKFTSWRLLQREIRKQQRQAGYCISWQVCVKCVKLYSDLYEKKSNQTFLRYRLKFLPPAPPPSFLLSVPLPGDNSWV